jgi:hypothetical protein
MSKIDNLALSLYNKDRHNLMKLYNNKRTSQLRKDIIREIFNQEGGEPFIKRIIDNDKIIFKKYIANENIGEVKYVSYVVTHDKKIVPYSKFILREENNFNSLLEDKFLDYFNKLEESDILESNDTDMIYYLLKFKKNKIIETYNLNYDIDTIINIITFGIIEFDDIIYIVGFRDFDYNKEQSFNKSLNLYYIQSASGIIINQKFQGLSICKSLYYNNITIYINDIHKDKKFFYIWVSADYKDGAFACYDNAFRRNGFNYRLTINDSYQNIKSLIKEDPYNKVLYFRELSDLVETALKTCTLLKYTIDKSLYEGYEDYKWYQLFYNEILTDYYWNYFTNIINIDINGNLSEINFREYNDSIKSIDIIIKSIIIPTDIYENKYNDIYILINKIN